MTSLLEKRVGELYLNVTLTDSAKVINKLTFTCDLEVVKRLERELSDFLGQVKVTSADLLCQKKETASSFSDNPVRVQPPAEWRFHSNHDQNIVLNNDGKRAERRGGDTYNGIVVGCLPMQVNTLYEVRLDKRDADTGWSMFTGVTLAAPDTLTLPSACYGYRWTAGIVIAHGYVAVKGNNAWKELGKKLRGLPVNSRQGVLVDDKRDLHLYIDGQDQGVAAPNVPDPCYPFFDVWHCYRQITVLPVTVIRK